MHIKKLREVIMKNYLTDFILLLISLFLIIISFSFSLNEILLIRQDKSEGSSWLIDEALKKFQKKAKK